MQYTDGRREIVVTGPLAVVTHEYTKAIAFVASWRIASWYNVVPSDSYINFGQVAQ